MFQHERCHIDETRMVYNLKKVEIKGGCDENQEPRFEVELPNDSATTLVDPRAVKTPDQGCDNSQPAEDLRSYKLPRDIERREIRVGKDDIICYASNTTEQVDL